jgi:tetratricopeptide (TPR) repeat protein
MYSKYNRHCGIILILLLSCLFSFNALAQEQILQSDSLSEVNETTGNTGPKKINKKAVEKLRKMTPEEIAAIDKKLAEALTFFYDNKHGQALPIFKEIAEQVETMDIMWWIGTTAMSTGNICLAITEFKKMLDIDPSLNRVRLDLALAFFKLGYYDYAREELKKVEAARPPEAVQQNIDKLFAAIAEKTRKVSWNIRFSQGITYDTNVNAGPDEREFEVWGGTLTLDSDSRKISDEALATSLQGNAIYDFGQRQGLMWNTAAVFYNSAYQTYSKYDFMMADIKTGPWWIGRRDILKCPVGYKEQYYGSDRLSNIIHVDPSYEHYFCRYFSMKALYSYNKESFYSDENRSLENKTSLYEISPSIYLANRRHIISGSVGYENRDAEASRFSYTAQCYMLSYYTRFSTTNTEFFLRYKWMEKDYKDKPILYTQDREDRRYAVTTVISQQFCEYFFASLAFNYTDNNSNASLYEFDKATYSFNVGFTF